MTRRFDEHYLGTLRRAYDAERQQSEALGVLGTRLAHNSRWRPLCARMQRDADAQADRLEPIFDLLYLRPTTDPCWATTALLREATEASAMEDSDLATSASATALLAVKRLELTRYEALIRWSIECGVDDAVPLIARSLAEEIVLADGLGALAFDIATVGIVPSRYAPPALSIGVRLRDPRGPAKSRF